MTSVPSISHSMKTWVSWRCLSINSKICRIESCWRFFFISRWVSEKVHISNLARKSVPDFITKRCICEVVVLLGVTVFLEIIFKFFLLTKESFLKYSTQFKRKTEGIFVSEVSGVQIFPKLWFENDGNRSRAMIRIIKCEFDDIMSDFDCLGLV